MKKKLSNLLNQKINLTKKELTVKEAEKMITKFNENNKSKVSSNVEKKETKTFKNKKN